MPARVRPGDDPTPEQREEIRRVKRALGVPVGEIDDGVFSDADSHALTRWKYRRRLFDPTQPNPHGVIDDDTLAAADAALRQRDLGEVTPEPNPPPWLTYQAPRLLAARSTAWALWHSSWRTVVQAGDLAAWRAPVGGTGSVDVVAQCAAATAAGADLSNSSTPHAYVATPGALRTSAMARGTWYTDHTQAQELDLVFYSTGRVGRIWMLDNINLVGAVLTVTGGAVPEWRDELVVLANANGFVRY